MHTIAKAIVLICTLYAAFMVNGCATGRAVMAPEQQEASLRLAAEQYWNARIEGKFEIAYALEDKEGLPADFTEYKLKAAQMMKLNPQNVVIDKIAIDGQRATVTVKFEIRVPNIAKPARKSVRDEWIFQKGKWLHRFPD